jgi:hypothetical protein
MINAVPKIRLTDVHKRFGNKVVLPGFVDPHMHSNFCSLRPWLDVGPFTTADMDEETAYFITRSFWQQREELAKTNAWWAGVSPDMVNRLGTKLHPGALRYYREAGVEIAPELN